MIVLKIATTISLAITGLAMVLVIISKRERTNIRLVSLGTAIAQVLAIAFMWQ